tara:strand:- start:48 stop:167 length:120 start_codon:yes stop_codon:yes gene_type:complete
VEEIQPIGLGKIIDLKGLILKGCPFLVRKTFIFIKITDE